MPTLLNPFHQQRCKESALWFSLDVELAQAQGGSTNRTFEDDLGFLAVAIHRRRFQLFAMLRRIDPLETKVMKECQPHASLQFVPTPIQLAAGQTDAQPGIVSPTVWRKFSQRCRDVIEHCPESGLP